MEDLFNLLSWKNISIIVICFILVSVLEKLFKIKRPKKVFDKINSIVFQRVTSLFFFFINWLQLTSDLVPAIEFKYPYFARLFLPDIMNHLLDIFQELPYMTVIYIVIGYGVCIRSRVPKDRLIRFNLMFSILLLTFQNIFHEIYSALYLEQNIISRMSEPALNMFLLYMIIFIPYFFRVLTGRYPSNAFIREAIEVHLGRDGPDFIWWDRHNRKKNNK
ncbi:unnamed protein product [Choristocarpus tenellus]